MGFYGLFSFFFQMSMKLFFNLLSMCQVLFTLKYRNIIKKQYLNLYNCLIFFFVLLYLCDCLQRDYWI